MKDDTGIEQIAVRDSKGALWIFVRQTDEVINIVRNGENYILSLPEKETQGGHYHTERL